MIRRIITDILVEARQRRQPALDFIHEAILSGDPPSADTFASARRKGQKGHYASRWGVGPGSGLPQASGSGGS